MRENEAIHPVNLRDYLTVLRARRWTILGVTVVVVAAVLGYSYLQTPRYTASARVLVKPIATSGNEAFVPAPDLQTESQVVASKPVATMVARRLRIGRSPDSLLGGLSVTPVGDSEVLSVSYTSTDPRLARAAAEAFAEDYLTYRRSQAEAQVRSSTEPVKAEIGRLEHGLSRLSDRIQQARGAGDDALATKLESRRNTLLARLGVLQQRLDDARPSAPLSSSGGQVIRPASLPTLPSSPNYRNNAVLALLVGLILGVALATLRDRMDERFRNRDELVAVFGAALLATIPKYEGSGNRTKPELLKHPHARASEAYRSLRTSVEFVRAQRQVKSIVVTSPVAGEGKTVTVANLGIALAQAGTKTVLVSADLRKPTIERYFGLSNDDGLSCWLADQSRHDIDPIVWNAGIPNLELVPSGPVPPNPAELLASHRLRELIAKLEETYAVVLLDTPPLLPVADAAIIASRVGEAIVVVNASRTRKPTAVHAREELARIGVRIVGTVFNDLDPSVNPYDQQDYYADYYGKPVATDGSNGSGHHDKKRSWGILHRS